MKRRRRSRKTPTEYTTLEPKRLLAGDLGDLNLVVNGDFSEVPAAGDRANFFDSDAVAGFDAANAADGQQIVLFTFGEGDDANTVLKLDSTADQVDLVEQDIATDAAETYIITFDLRGQEVDGDLVSETVEVFWDGESVGTFLATNQFTTHAVIVDGSPTGVSTLGFGEAADGDNPAGNGVGVLIDNVNVAVVNESSGVTNGSFEQSTGDGPFFSNGNIPGWTALDRGGRPDLIQLQTNGTNPNAPATDGTVVLNLDTTSDVVDHVFSDFETTEGASYFVTFDLFADGSQDVDPDEVRVRWKTPDSAISPDQWIATVFGTSEWQSYGFLVDGLGDLSRLELREPAGSPGDGSGALIDNVRLFLVDQGENPITVGAIEDQTVAFGESLQIQTVTENADGETLNFAASVAGLSVTESQPTVSDDGEFSWIPTEAGQFDVTVSAADASGALAEQTFSVTVGSLLDIDPEDRNDIYPTAPGFSIDTDNTYDAILDTDVGTIEIRLLDNESPTFVNNFVNLAEDGFYDGLVFHRVVENFVAQGGDPLGTGTGGPGYEIPDEVGNTIPFDSRGQLSFANSGNDTTGSQFFITFDATNLNTDQFSVFGNVTAGDDVLDQIVRTFIPNPNPSPFEPAEIAIPGAVPTIVNSITIVETEGDDV